MIKKSSISDALFETYKFKNILATFFESPARISKK